ncbi:reverse transcriptase domain-containing protein [Tanacetum coccineum]
MSTNEQTPLSQPTSVVRNTLRKESAPQDLGRPISDEALREYCDRNYHQILPIIAKKVHQEKVQQEKLKAVKARLNFEEASHHSESGTPIRRRDLKERLGPRYVRSRSRSPEPRRGRSESPKKKGPERKAVFKRLEKGVFHRLGDKGKSVSVHSDDSRRWPHHSSRRDTKSYHQSSHSRATESASKRHYNKRTSSRRTEELSESKGSAGGHWKSKLKRQKLNIEDDLSQPWVCEETDPFTPQIYYFDFPKTRMPSHIKTYDENEDPEDHLKIFQSAAKTERWAMPTWCHIYDDLKKAFIENYLQQKKYIKDPVEIHNIRQRDGESTKEFVRRYKLECKDVKGAPKCMKISGFMHGITNPELIKRLHDKIPKSVDEMMRVTTAFLRGEVAASNRKRKKSFPSWKQQKAGQKHNFKKGSFRNQQRPERKQDRFTLLTKTPKEILALDKGKFKTPPPMTTPVEKRDASKFCEFHREVGHTTDECMHLKKQIEEMLKAGKLSHLIKELKQSAGNGAVQREGRETLGKTQATTPSNVILSIQRNYWKTTNQETTGSSVNGSRNVKAPGRRRSHYPKKQQVGSAGMCVGLRPEETPQALKPMVEERVKVAINPEYPEQTVMIGSTLTDEGRNKLCNLLQQNLDIFAWKPADMTGVPRHITEHRLNVREGCSPVRQKKRGQAADRNQAIQEEVKKLVEAGIMKEVHYHDWLSNPVMVKKHDDSWRMCVDFKDLNKACPKDGYPLPEIDWKMPFGLRNAETTYQRLVDKAFYKQIGRNLEVYVDDLVIKSRTEDEIVRDIEETFKTLREISMKLNPKKCTFGVEEGMFLGYKVNTKGLKVCPDKVDAVLSLPSPKCLKDVQKLKGKLAILNRFLAKSAEKSLSFFKTLKKCTKKSDFHWTAKAEEAFKQMKQLIVELPMLTAPMEKEELIVYLAAAKETVSAVLMTEREAKQMPIYFVSRALRGPKLNYTSMEKLALALVHASKRLKRYFQAHLIIVITDQPIQQVLSRPEVAGRLQKWSIELGEYAIHYRPRVSVKGHVEN